MMLETSPKDESSTPASLGAIPAAVSTLIVALVSDFCCTMCGSCDSAVDYPIPSPMLDLIESFLLLSISRARSSSSTREFDFFKA